MFKKRNCYIFICVLPLLFLLVACGKSTFSTENAKLWTKEKFPDLKYTYVGVAEEDPNGTPILWTFQCQDESKMEFHVRGVKQELLGQEEKYDYVTDYFYLLAKEAFGSYKGEKDAIQVIAPMPTNSEPRVFIRYENLAQLKKACQEAQGFNDYLKEKAKIKDILFYSLNINSQDEYYTGLVESEIRSYPHEAKPIGDLLYEDSVNNLFLVAIQHGFAHQYFSPEEIENRVKDMKEYHFTVFTPEGQAYYWPDLLKGDGYEEGFTRETLFEVLSRTNYPSLQGNKDAFFFQGANGKEYGFMKKFYEMRELENEIHEVKKYRKHKDSYYLENLERVVGKPSFEEITGYKVQEGWTDKVLEKE